MDVTTPRLTARSPRKFDEREQLFIDIKRHNMAGLQQLLDRNPDLKVLHPTYGFPLLLAVEADNIEAIKLLVLSHADINGNAHGTALHRAVAGSKTEILDFLLETGADPSILDDSGETALFAALRANDLSTVTKLVASGSPLDTIGNSGDCPVTLAVLTKNLSLVRHLLEKGADPNPHPKGKHPLETARDLKLERIINVLTLAGSRDVARGRRSSTQHHKIKVGRTQSIQRRIEGNTPREQGQCFICGECEGLYRLLPCGHRVVCGDCLEFFTTYAKSCPTCKLAYIATRKA
jgi:ankyrin repeat protein